MAWNFSEIMAKQSSFLSRGVLLRGSLLGIFFLSAAGRADEMNSYVALSGNVIQSLSSIEKGTRGGGKIEFARLPRWVAMDLRFASGNHYTDLGAILKFYKHWKFSEEDSATGISLGMGAGILSSTGVDNGSYADGNATVDGGKRSFMDIVAHPFTRYVWDTGRGFGIVADLGVDIVPRRSYQKKDDVIGNKDDHMRYRVQASVGFALEVD